MISEPSESYLKSQLTLQEKECFKDSISQMDCSEKETSTLCLQYFVEFKFKLDKVHIW